MNIAYNTQVTFLGYRLRIIVSKPVLQGLAPQAVPGYFQLVCIVLMVFQKLEFHCHLVAQSVLITYLGGDTASLLLCFCHYLRNIS